MKERTRSATNACLVTTLTKKMAEDLTDYLFEQGIKVRYLHSDIGTLERVDILRDLREGEFDVLVGINLLREGLDLPEVSLVAILDADKEGFLRNYRSLIQTIGRAARNVSRAGHHVCRPDHRLHAAAIDETERRRASRSRSTRITASSRQTIRKAITDIVQYVREGADDHEAAGRQGAVVATAGRGVRLISSWKRRWVPRRRRSTSSRPLVFAIRS